MIHTFSYTQERSFNCPAMAFSSDVELKIDSSLEESLSVTVLIFRYLWQVHRCSWRFSFRIRGSQQSSSQLLKYPSLQTIDMDVRKNWCDDIKSSTSQDIATCFQSVCVKSRRFTEDSSMQSIMIPTEGQRRFHPQLDDAESSTGLVWKNGRLSHSQRDRSMLAGLRA